MAEQRVNSLLWECDSAARAFIALLRQLAVDLRAGDVTRVLPQTASDVARDSPGQPALEFLSANMGDLRRCKLQLIRQHTAIPLALPSQQRLSRTARANFPHVADETTEQETQRAINFALSGVANMAELIALKYEGRRVQQHGGQVDVIRAMTGCLDLLQMSRSRSNDAYMQAGPGHLRVLAKWARHSVSSVPVGNGETIEREPRRHRAASGRSAHR